MVRYDGDSESDKIAATKSEAVITNVLSLFILVKVIEDFNQTKSIIVIKHKKTKSRCIKHKKTSNVS